jgi:hypothetical protein
VRNIALVFLMAVLSSAVTEGLRPALFASAHQRRCLNFFFLQPLYTLDISDPESVVALLFFLIVAIIASNLTAASSGRPPPPASGRAPPKTSICSARSWPAPARWTMCSGPRPSSSPRC